MAEATAFVIANFTIHDADTYRIYEKGFFPILKKHGGTFHTYDDNNANGRWPLAWQACGARTHARVQVPRSRTPAVTLRLIYQGSQNPSTS